MIRSADQRRQIASTLRGLRQGARGEFRALAAWWIANRPAVLTDLPDPGLTLRNLRRRAGELWHLHRPRNRRRHQVRLLQIQLADQTDRACGAELQAAKLEAVNEELRNQVDRMFLNGYQHGLDQGLGIGWVNGQKFKVEAEGLEDYST